MKTGIIFLIAVLSLVLVSNAAWAEDYFTLSYDCNGNENFSIHSANVSSTSGLGGSWGANDAFSLGYEHLFQLNKKSNLGFGLEYQFPRSQNQNGWSGDINFIPVYGVINYRLPSKFAPFFNGRLGFNFFNVTGNYGIPSNASGWAATTAGGLYWAAGFGIQPVDQVRIELLYSEGRGSLEYKQAGGNFINYDLVYSKLSFMVGYNF